MSLARQWEDRDEAPGDAESAPAAPALVALPRRLTPFFGRDDLVARVVAQVGDPGVRLLTLTGPGGVGKTRLAVRAGEVAAPAFPDGVHFVSLAPVVDPGLVLPAIGRLVDVPAGGERPLVERLADALAGRRALVILDNFEQVLGAAPELARLLQGAPGLTILATSRAPLHLDGERELVVPPLALPRARRSARQDEEPEAVRFFLERARAVRPGLEMTPSASAAVAQIVRRLDGLPLALELAAARTKVLSPEALLVRLERQLHVLTGGPQDRPERQRTMRDAIAWSYGLLDETEQVLFRRLAVFRGGFSLEDAETVLGPGSGVEPALAIDVLDGVTALVDQSLVATEAEGDGVRFRMLETIREFALEQLGLSGELEAAQSSFGAHWTRLAEGTWRHTAVLEELDRALTPLDRNADNVRAALDWLETNDPERAAELAGALSWFWYLRGHHAEALERIRRLLAMPESSVPRGRRPRLLLAAGWSAHFQANTAEAVPFLEAALELWRERDDAWGMGFTLLVLGVIAEDDGAYGRARALLLEAVDRLGAAGDAGSVASARYHLAVVAFGAGDLDAAERLVGEVLGDRHGPAVRVAGWAVHLRGLIAAARGDAAGALASQQEALRRFADAGYVAGVSEALAGVAVAAAGARLALGARLWAVAERMTAERGDPFRPPERTVYETAAASLRRSLGDEAFAAEYGAGRDWTQEEAIEAALALRIEQAAAAPGLPGKLADLSGREIEVLRLVANGWTNERIGDELFLSPRTVSTHLTNIFRKLGVDNRVEAVRIATAAGLPAAG